VVISGAGGVGKSTLAIHAAHQLAAQFPDGQLYADLRATGPAQVAVHFVTSLGGQFDGRGEPVAAWRNAAAGRRLLVVLDDAVHERQISPLLAGSSGTLIIVTSRQVLGALPKSRAIRLDVLDLTHAVELLDVIAETGPEADPALTELAELCGRLPLALRIAGSRIASSGAADAAHRARLLTGRLRDSGQRLRQLTAGETDLEAVFGLSYQPLAERERFVYRCCGLFPGADFTPGAIAALADLPVADAERALDLLADASLVRPASPGRYQMHDLLRLYATGLVASHDDAAFAGEAVGRLARSYLAQVDLADRMIMPARGRPSSRPPAASQDSLAGAAFADAAQASAWYDAEHGNLIAVTKAAASNGHKDAAWRIPVAMRGLLEFRAQMDDWIAVHQIGLESARAAEDRAGQGWLLNGLGIACHRRGQQDEAIEYYKQARAIRAELGDERGVAVTLVNLGTVYGRAGRYPEAFEALNQALAIRERLGDTLDKSFALTSLGHLQHERRLFTEAVASLEEALQIRRDLGNRNGEAATLHCLGDTMAGLGQGLEALARLRQAFVIFREVGNRYGQATALHSIGSTCRTMGRFGPAERYLLRAAERYREIGHHDEQQAVSAELAAMLSGRR
jgi:tetratricopeptide (TPR) repeat protein